LTDLRGSTSRLFLAKPVVSSMRGEGVWANHTGKIDGIPEKRIYLVPKNTTTTQTKHHTPREFSKKHQGSSSFDNSSPRFSIKISTRQKRREQRKGGKKWGGGGGGFWVCVLVWGGVCFVWGVCCGVGGEGGRGGGRLGLRGFFHEPKHRSPRLEQNGV